MEGLAMLEAWESDNTLEFLNGGATDYLEVIDSKINNAEPVLLKRETTVRQPKNQKFLGEKNFFD